MLKVFTRLEEEENHAAWLKYPQIFIKKKKKNYHKCRLVPMKIKHICQVFSTLKRIYLLDVVYLFQESL